MRQTDAREAFLARDRAARDAHYATPEGKAELARSEELEKQEKVEAERRENERRAGMSEEEKRVEREARLLECVLSPVPFYGAVCVVE